MAVTRSTFAGALRDHYGVDPNKDRKLIGYLWDYFKRDVEDGANLEELVRYAEGYVGAYLLKPEGQAANTGEQVSEVDFTRALGGRDPEGEEAEADSRRREWIGHRVAAFSEYLTKILATDEGVIGFRKRALESPTATLAPEQAERFVRSPAAAVFPFTFFEERSVSLTDHEATTESYEKTVENGDGFHRTTVRIEPAGIRETVRSLDLSQGALETLYWSGSDNQEFALHINVWSGSVLGELQRLGKRLSDKHPWQPDQAVNFVLTGAPQLASTLKAKIRRSFNKGVKAHKYNSATIVIEAGYWVPAEEVTRAYRKLQREAREGGKNRRPADRNIAIFRYVVDRGYVCVKSVEENLARIAIPKWRDMLRSWNEDHPPGNEWHYEDEEGKGVQRFHRDFKRGQRMVIGSYSGLPGDPNQPMTRAELKAYHEHIMERWGASP